jgi:hypothetical protein
MGKPSKRKYLQTFLERTLEMQRHSQHPESFAELVLWAKQRLEQSPPRQGIEQSPAAQARPQSPKKPKPKLDPDLASFSQKALKYEVQRLRDAIRAHRNQHGQDDDQELYKVLPKQT